MAKENLFTSGRDPSPQKEDSGNRRPKEKPVRRKARRFKKGKLLIRVFSILVGVVIFFGVVYLGMHWREVTTNLVDRFFFENPRFNVLRVDVSAQGPFPKDWMQSIPTVDAGTNIYRVDPESLRLEVKRENSWIDQFQVTKDPGGGVIDIAIQARTPVGELVDNPGGREGALTRFFLDPDGVVFRISDPYVLRGISEPLILVRSLDLRDGFSARSPQTRLAGAFIQRFELSSLGLVAFIDVVDARLQDSLQVTLKGGATAVFRSRDFDLDLEKWARILGEKTLLAEAAPSGAVLVFPDRAEPFFALGSGVETGGD